ncbi:MULTISPECIES: glycosyltransferase family 4 protein [unclassified Roseofilum]|uniref:glycosyltransferase family 4 protein n=1 Tax=unclassified Roseofilum TaxID=2620099 RepID=UPI001B28EAAE|nr:MULTISPECIES: glycosyltransferase family 4 protein [unclassified Roseofilum]MBP0010133.1 glycosyltransferase family 4 protein [Roseofilum sp. Belize Diploria]MBP0032060.1 glycosyltransferase family 4 protein [Roseofilum sp. Belize BBD 4]
MKVVYITPTYFSDRSLIGGAERYASTLASLMAEHVDTTLVSFGPHRQSYQEDNLNIEIFPVKAPIHGNMMNAIHIGYISSLLNATIIHIHHIYTLVSDVSCLIGHFLGKRVFVTDHGGGGSLVISHKLPVFRCYTNLVAQSEYTLGSINDKLSQKAVTIKGGVDTNWFYPTSTVKKEKKILFVGRVIPHKGINYLIEGFKLLAVSDYKLTIVGRIKGDISQKFYRYLRKIAEGLPVEFIQDADDRRLLQEYRSAIVTVLPSVHTTCYGDYTAVPELMGFTLLESQASGTPVICTDAGAMHEFVNHGKTGLVVEQNSGQAIAKALQHLIQLSSQDYQEYQKHSIKWIANNFSWSIVVKKHLELYQGIANSL